MLMRRSIAQPEEIAYYLCYGPSQTNAHELIRIAGRRWSIQDCFEAAKGEVGLDEYEVRKWGGKCMLPTSYPRPRKDLIPCSPKQVRRAAMPRPYSQCRIRSAENTLPRASMKRPFV